MTGFVFLCWALGFWPAIGLTYHLLANQQASYAVPFALESVLGLLSTVWLVGGYVTYRLYQTSQLAAIDSSLFEEDEDEVGEPNTILVVKVPENRRTANQIFLESDAFFDTLPQQGDRLILNGEDADDFNIFGHVRESAEFVRKTSRQPGYIVWIDLDNANEFSVLAKMDGWRPSVRKNAGHQTLHIV